MLRVFKRSIDVFVFSSATGVVRCDRVAVREGTIAVVLDEKFDDEYFTQMSFIVCEGWAGWVCWDELMSLSEHERKMKVRSLA